MIILILESWGLAEVNVDNKLTESSTCPSYKKKYLELEQGAATAVLNIICNTIIQLIVVLL